MAATAQTQRDARLEILKLKAPLCLPAMAQQVLKSLLQEDVDISHLADDIEKCPGLTARILGLANSAYFGCRRTLYTVSDATVVIGLNMVRSVGLAMVLSDPLNTKSCPAFNPQRYWFSALLTAFAARRLAPSVAADKRPKADSAYLSGLLHNFGLPVLVHLFPKEMQLAFANGDNGSATVYQASREQLGVDHHVAGAWVMQKWKLPSDIVSVVEHYRDRSYRGNHWVLCQLIGLCHGWIEAILQETDDRDDDATELQALGIKPADAAEVRERSLEQVVNLTRLAQMMAGE